MKTTREDNGMDEKLNNLVGYVNGSLDALSAYMTTQGVMSVELFREHNKTAIIKTVKELVEEQIRLAVESKVAEVRDEINKLIDGTVDGKKGYQLSDRYELGVYEVLSLPILSADNENNK